jgi:hypothetical protein
LRSTSSLASFSSFSMAARSSWANVSILLGREAGAVGAALFLALRQAGLPRGADRRPRRPALGHCRIVRSRLLAELGRHGLFCVSGGAQPLTEIFIFHSTHKPDLFARLGALPNALDAGDVAFGQRALFLLGPRDHADGPVVAHLHGIVDPQIGRAVIVVVHCEDH